MVLSTLEDQHDVQLAILYDEVQPEDIKESDALQAQHYLSTTDILASKEPERLMMSHSIVDLVLVNNSPTSGSKQRNSNTDEPDRGYAWVILLCCTILQLIYSIPVASTGLFYMEFVESCGLDISTAAWMCSLLSSISQMFGPVSAWLVDITSTRTVTLIGCLGSGITLAIASFTTDPTILFVTYGVLAGAFCNCMYTPAVTFPTTFFDKYKSLALSASTCFVPLATVIFTPCIVYFIQTFGWRDATLFMAAICIQSTVLATLLRPARMKTPKVEHGEVVQSTLTSTINLFGEPKNTTFNDSKSSATLRTHYEHVLEADEYTLTKSNGTVDITPQALCENPTPGDNNEQGQQDKAEQSGYSTTCSRILGEYQSILHWRVGVLVLSCFVHGWAGGIFYILLPDCASMQGLTVRQISHLLMLIGVVGFASRVSFTLIGYKVTVSKAVTAPISLLVMSSAFVGVIFSTDYIHFVIASSVYITGYAGFTCYGGPVILEMHGDSHLGIIYGLEMFTYGIGCSIAPPTSAWLYLLTGSYIPGHIISCTALAVGAMLYLPHICSTYKKNGWQMPS